MQSADGNQHAISVLAVHLVERSACNQQMAISMQSAYSRSISLSVAMCSKTNEMGTSTREVTPELAIFSISEAVDGSSQRSCCGPKAPWQRGGSRSGGDQKGSGGDPKGSEGIRRGPEGIRWDPMGSEGVRTEPKGSEGIRREPKGSEGIRREPKGSEGRRWEAMGGGSERRPTKADEEAISRQ